MNLTGTLGTGLDATSNPDPNGLTTKNPFPSTFQDEWTVSSSWTSQAKKGLFPRNHYQGDGSKAIRLHFVPSGGAAVTYTVTMWVYNKISNTWVKPKNTPSVSYTGANLDTIETPGTDPIFLQLSSISAGTISVYFDAALAQAL